MGLDVATFLGYDGIVGSCVSEQLILGDWASINILRSLPSHSESGLCGRLIYRSREVRWVEACVDELFITCLSLSIEVDNRYLEPVSDSCCQVLHSVLKSSWLVHSIKDHAELPIVASIHVKTVA